MRCFRRAPLGRDSLKMAHLRCANKNAAAGDGKGRSVYQGVWAATRARHHGCLIMFRASRGPQRQPTPQTVAAGQPDERAMPSRDAAAYIFMSMERLGVERQISMRAPSKCGCWRQMGLEDMQSNLKCLRYTLQQSALSARARIACNGIVIMS